MPNEVRHLTPLLKRQPCHCEFKCVILSAAEGPTIEGEARNVSRTDLVFFHYISINHFGEL